MCGIINKLMYFFHKFKAFVMFISHADPSDTDLRHALANLIAAVFALPEGSNHMWYHMFSPKD